MPLSPRIDRLERHTFLPHLLPDDAIIVDLGANEGRFSASITSKYNCRSYAVEPSPDIWARIPTSPKVQKFNLAIAPTDGPIAFNVCDNSESSSLYSKNIGNITRRIQVDGFTLPRFLQHIQVSRIDLLKMDIEGAEFAVLESLDESCLQCIGQLCVEFHPGVGPYTLESVHNVVARLAQSGFAGTRMSFTTHADYLFVNRRLTNITTMQLVSLRTVKKAFALADRVYSHSRQRVRGTSH